jgi:hypothetical protein
MIGHEYDLSFIEEKIFDGSIDWGSRKSMALFGHTSNYQGRAIGINELIAWMSEGHINPVGTQNRSPEYWELAAYGQQLLSAYDSIKLSYGGYVIHPRRADARVSIDTVYVVSQSDSGITDEIDEDTRILFPAAGEFRRTDDIITMWWD